MNALHPHRLSVSLLLLFLTLASAQVWPYTFTATLTKKGLAETVETDRSGTAIAVLTGNQLVVTGVYGNLSSPIQGDPKTFFGVYPSGPNIRLMDLERGDPGVAPRLGSTWTLEDSIFTFSDIDNGCSETLVAYLVHTKHGTAYQVVLESNNPYASVGETYFHRRVEP